MKIFKTYDWYEKINFVDDNNVFVGYDYRQDCCESFGYFFSLEPKKYEYGVSLPEENENDFDLSTYVFDPSWYHENEASDRYTEFNSVIFRLISEGNPDIYLTLYNCHNGYYGHGFEFTNDKFEIVKGVL